MDQKGGLLESNCLIKCYSATGGERVNAEKYQCIHALLLVLILKGQLRIIQSKRTRKKCKRGM